jgi:hypothetical protein
MLLIVLLLLLACSLEPTPPRIPEDPACRWSPTACTPPDTMEKKQVPQ